MDRLPKHITLKHLNAFVAVAQEASFTHAARRLFQTQSSVTGLIQQLEVALNTTLFNRTSRRVSLTPIGLEFLPRITRLLAENNISIEALIQKGSATDGSAEIVILTHRVVEKSANKAIEDLRTAGAVVASLQATLVITAGAPPTWGATANGNCARTPNHLPRHLMWRVRWTRGTRGHSHPGTSPPPDSTCRSMKRLGVPPVVRQQCVCQGVCGQVAARL